MIHSTCSAILCYVTKELHSMKHLIYTIILRISVGVRKLQFLLDRPGRCL